MLVIHPYARLIESQYEKREVLFKNADILPEFDLITVKAVQTIAGNRDDRSILGSMLWIICIGRQ